MHIPPDAEGCALCWLVEGRSSVGLHESLGATEAPYLLCVFWTHAQSNSYLHPQPLVANRIAPGSRPMKPPMKAVVGPVLVCVCAGGYTSAAEDDGTSMGPDGKQLWPCEWLAAMTAAYKEPLSRRQSDGSQTVC